LNKVAQISRWKKRIREEVGKQKKSSEAYIKAVVIQAREMGSEQKQGGGENGV